MLELEPLPDRDFPSGRLQARRDHLVDEVRAAASSGQRRRWPGVHRLPSRVALQRRLIFPAAALGAIVVGVLVAIDQTTGGTSPASAAVRVAVAPLEPGANARTAGSSHLIVVDAREAARARTQRHNLEIVGGGAAQRDLLRAILSRMPGTSLTRVAIVPKVYRDQHGVGLETAATPGDPLRADWEEMLLAGAFRDFSVRQGLPPVVGLPPAAATSGSDETVASLVAKVRAAAAAARAEVDDLRIYRPERLAPAVVLRVEDPAAFLKRRLPGFLAAVGDRWRDYDGAFIEVVDRDASFVWGAGTNPLTSHGSVGTRPDLAGCSPIVNFFSTPPACPAS